MTDTPTPAVATAGSAGDAARADRVAERVTAYIRDAFLDGDPRGELTERTRLLEWGVLSSLKMTQLLVFLREGLDEADRVTVPALEISGRNFRDVRAIAELVDRLASA